MIEIVCKDELYTYNVYHLTKAFFPEEQIKQIEENQTETVVSVSLSSGHRYTVNLDQLSVFSDRRERKYYVDKSLYEFLERISGFGLSWGLLTGVRPVKIAMQKLKGGMDKEGFVNWFRQELLVSQNKAALAFEIAEREKKILENLDCRDGYSLYIGIPFCPSVCSYCSFSSGSVEEWKGEIDNYLDALLKELTYIGEVSKRKKLNSIYIGGGTPTSLEEKNLERLFSHIAQHFSTDYLLEYTVEAGRPDSINKEKLILMKKYGVTRISVNPQTMQQKTLNIIGRNHTIDEIVATYRLARELGFDNINMDIIAGLPGETIADMGDTLRQIQELAPDSLTVHALAIKRAARYGQEKKSKGRIEDFTNETYAAETVSGMIELSMKSAESMGLSPYYLYRQKNIAGNFENVGYAKVDKAGIYNILIMEELQTIIAAGAGTSTKIVLQEEILLPGSRQNKKTKLIRIENVKDIREYITRVDEMIDRKGEWLWH